MCGRYVMALRAGDLGDVLDAEVPEPERLRLSYNIAPTSTVPILVERYEEPEGAAPTDGAATTLRREVHPARWGLLPHWAKDASFSSKTFNARSETAAEKPSFRAAVRRRRCAVPAQGYYEWRAARDPHTGRTVRQPFHIAPADGSLILFAGLYEWWQDPQLLASGDPAPWVLSTTILTGAAPVVGDDCAGEGGGREHGDADGGDEVLRALADIHDRLPLALAPRTLESWLDPEPWSADQAEAAVAGLRGTALECARGWGLHEVDRAVGDVRNDSPELIEPPSRLL
ncbi:SOS response-associated peptidase [Nesterenkonia marinintestina]|uniref:SOS response-associated peptidase n=1 Tax=Nesterenkonia marinintestina TaxID=2979865 RepID=UPI0021C070BD|nr:SOS response-associated peptidase [Nesterenkonia sp. GX14115]